MLCMTEETFGPTLPVMRVADAEEAVELANDGRYGLQASVWTRDVERGEALARRIEAGVACVNDAQLNYARDRAADGRLEGVGARLPPRRRRHPQVHEAPVAPGHPRLRAAARAAHVPLHRRGHRARSARRWPPSPPASSSTTPSGRRSRSSATRSSPRSSRRPTTARTDPTGFWARSATDLGVPEAVELALLQAGLPEEQLLGLARPARRPRRQRDGRRALRRRRARRSSTASWRTRRRSIGDRRPAQRRADHPLRAPRPRHRHQPELARRWATRARRRCRSPRAQGPAADQADRPRLRGADARGRRRASSARAPAAA